MAAAGLAIIAFHFRAAMRNWPRPGRFAARVGVAKLSTPTSHSRFTPVEGLLAFLIAAGTVCAIGARPFASMIAHRALLNPDSYMRLVRLRDELEAHAPLHAVMRDGSGHGTILHWSHWLDSVLLAMAAPLASALGWDTALYWAGIALGPLATGLLGAAVAWAGAPLSAPRWRWIGALIVAMAFPVMSYGVPGVVHHHVPVALAGIMCAGWAARVLTHGAAAGWNLGVWAGLGIWISPETAPLALLAFGAAGIAWVAYPRTPGPAQALRALGCAFPAVIGLALAVDPPARGYFAGEIDRLSIAYVWLSGLCAVSCWFLASAGIERPAARMVAAIATALAACGVWLALYPQALGGADGVLKGGDAEAFSGIVEMMPIDNLRTGLRMLTAGVAGLATAILFAARTRSLVWTYAALCMGLLMLVAMRHQRFATYPACAGAIAVPVLLTLIDRMRPGRPPALPAAARLGVILSVLLLPFLPRFMARPMGSPVAGPCDLAMAAPILAPFPGEIVLTDVNDTPEVLYRSEVRTVGSLYHRNPEGFALSRAAWRAAPGDSVPEAVRRTDASLVLFCRNAARSGSFIGAGHDTLWDALTGDRAPAWLTRVGNAPRAGYILYTIETR